MGSFSIWHWMVVLIIVLLIFGTKKLRNIGADLGGAVRGFKEGMRSAADEPADEAPKQVGAPGQTIDAEVKRETKA